MQPSVKTGQTAPPPVPEMPHEDELPHGNILDNKQAHAKLDHEFAVAQSQGQPLSIITADLNALKAINDELGHDEGDDIIDTLLEVFGTMEQTLRLEEGDDGRAPDVVSRSAIDYSPFEDFKGLSKGAAAGRVGGDEFHIILPDTDEVGAQVVVERLREVFSKHLAGPLGAKYRERGINVGLAIGTATLQPDMEGSSDLLRVSDQRMYKDKMSQLRPLSEEEIQHLILGLEHISKANVRPRDVPRYIEWLGEKGVERMLSTPIDDIELTEKLF